MAVQVAHDDQHMTNLAFDLTVFNSDVASGPVWDAVGVRGPIGAVASGGVPGRQSRHGLPASAVRWGSGQPLSSAAAPLLVSRFVRYAWCLRPELCGYASCLSVGGGTRVYARGARLAPPRAFSPSPTCSLGARVVDRSPCLLLGISDEKGLGTPSLAVLP